jgi:hypothetical protein
MKFDVSPQGIGWIKDRYLDETLTIRPPYQRRPVWGLRQKAKLIESVLLKLPIPEIFIDESTDEHGKAAFAIVDGQQRTRAILQFLGLDRDPLEQDYNDFTLETLDLQSPYKDKSFKDLSVDDRKDFFGYKFSIRTIYNPGDLEVRDTFKRINEYLTKLNEQELRNATYSGPFVKLVEACADDPFWSDNEVFTNTQVRRMKDLQFVSELLIGTAYGPQGGSGTAIDEYYKTYEEYEDELPDQNDIVARYKYALNSVQTLFPDFSKAGRYKNLGDHYSLFVALATTKSQGKIIPAAARPLGSLRTALLKFAEQVSKRLADGNARVSDEAVKYARAIEKAVNDKSRRAARHAVLMALLEDHLVPE